MSELALEHLMKGKWDSHTLQYDHMVPKTEYIRNVCEDAAMKGPITTEFIFDIFMKYFWVATIHKDENNLLSKKRLKNKMPEDWDGINILARYETVGIKFMELDKTYCSCYLKLNFFLKFDRLGRT